MESVDYKAARGITRAPGWVELAPEFIQIPERHSHKNKKRQEKQLPE